MRTRTLILAPAGRDAPLIQAALAQAEISSLACGDLAELCAALDAGAGTALVTGEALADADVRPLEAWIAAQPSWSDFPFLVLVDHGNSAFQSWQEFGPLRTSANVTLLERPVHAATLVSAVRAALRARRRQYEVQDTLGALADSEQRYRGLAANLEGLVTERTHSLAEANDRLTKEIADRERAEAALLQAQKLESIGQLTSGVAHDFNNLLTAVLGNIELAQRRIGDDPARRALQLAAKAVDRGAKLTAQLLAFSRKQRLAARPVDINRLVTNAGDMLFRTMGATIQIETRLDSELWLAFVDPTQLELVLLNLAINGRDAMKDGGRLTIRTANVAAAGRPPDLPARDYVMVSVSDTGSGMAEDVRAKAFEPFFTTKEIGKGSGLGLSMVHGVAVQSGGNVYLDSRLGAGTTVRLYLPRSTAEAAAADAPALPAASNGGPATILVVDDDPDVRDIAVSGLRDFGYQVIEAENGYSALERLEHDRVDLVLVDVAMPGLNGIETVRRARKTHPHLRAIFMSGYADTNIFAPIVDDVLLQKPYRLDKLANAVTAALQA
jgi:signal transduction histidine kinase